MVVEDTRGARPHVNGATDSHATQSDQAMAALPIKCRIIFGYAGIVRVYQRKRVER